MCQVLLWMKIHVHRQNHSLHELTVQETLFAEWNFNAQEQPLQE